MADLPFYMRDGEWDEVRYDIDASVLPDIVGSLQDMSIIDDGSVDSLFSKHNIEHVSSFEVDTVLRQFHRVLRANGFAAIMCPDIVSVARAIVEGNITNQLYHSPAGPISAIDILYGLQWAIASGNVYMAHKTAFSAETLSASLMSAGFAGVVVARDIYFGLHSIATPTPVSSDRLAVLLDGFFPPSAQRIGVLRFGCYA